MSPYGDSVKQWLQFIYVFLIKLKEPCTNIGVGSHTPSPPCASLGPISPSVHLWNRSHRQEYSTWLTIETYERQSGLRVTGPAEHICGQFYLGTASSKKGLSPKIRDIWSAYHILFICPGATKTEIDGISEIVQNSQQNKSVLIAFLEQDAKENLPKQTKYNDMFYPSPTLSKTEEKKTFWPYLHLGLMEHVKERVLAHMFAFLKLTSSSTSLPDIVPPRLHTSVCGLEESHTLTSMCLAEPTFPYVTLRYKSNTKSQGQRYHMQTL